MSSKVISYRLSRNKVISRNNKPKVMIEERIIGQQPANTPQHKATVLNIPNGLKCFR